MEFIKSKFSGQEIDNRLSKVTQNETNISQLSESVNSKIDLVNSEINKLSIEMDSKLESKISPKSYYRYIIFDNGNSYINLNCTSTTSSSKYFQNVRIGLGINNGDAYKTINDANVGQIYETLYRPANSQTITI